MLSGRRVAWCVKTVNVRAALTVGSGHRTVTARRPPHSNRTAGGNQLAELLMRLPPAPVDTQARALIEAVHRVQLKYARLLQRSRVECCKHNKWWIQTEWRWARPLAEMQLCQKMGDAQSGTDRRPLAG